MMIRPQMVRWLKRHRREIWTLLGAAVLVGVLLVFTHQWWDELFEFLRGLPAWGLILAAAVLPVAGGSVALVYVVVGARFGGGMGLAVIAVVTAFHLIVSHLIARQWLRRPVEHYLRRRKYGMWKLGAEKPAAFSLLLALVPGLPYFVRNYLLALSGVPFRIYFAVCWPVYVARSAVVVLAGGWGEDLSRRQIAWLGVIYVVKLGLCFGAVWHLRRHRHRRRGSPGAARVRAT